MTPAAKSRAWSWAARLLHDAAIASASNDALLGHVLDVIAPSLRRRAAIIRRNAKPQRKTKGERK